jgi:hypothetical protein
MGIAGAVAVLFDICLTHFTVHDMNDESRDSAGKLGLNFVVTENERSHFDGRIVLHCFGSLCFVTI